MTKTPLDAQFEQIAVQSGDAQSKHASDKLRSELSHVLIGGAAIAGGFTLAAVFHNPEAAAELGAVVGRLGAEGAPELGAATRLVGESARIADGTSQLATLLTDAKPQVVGGKLQYYFGGSLGSNLIAQAGRYTELGSDLSSVTLGKTVELSPRAQESLSHFVRQIGDVDTVALKDAVSRYGKGGSGPAFNDLPDSVRAIFKKAPDGHKIMFDPLSNPLEHDVVAVNVGGKDVFVAHPVSSLKWKVMHNLEAFDRADPGKMRSDFENLLNVAQDMRSRPALVSETAKLLNAYGGENASGLFLHDQNPMWSGPLKAFTDDVIASHPDAKYLEGLQVGRERSIGVLRSLSRLENDSDKQAVIEFINKHPNFVDNWGLRQTAHNKELLAREIIANRPELLKSLSGLKDTTVESVAEKLDSYPGVMSEAATSLPRESLEWAPASVEGLPMLNQISPQNVKPELEMIGRLDQLGVDSYDLSKALGSTQLPHESRMPVLRAWEQLARTHSGNELRDLNFEIGKTLDPIWTKTSSLEERMAMLKQLLGTDQI